MIQNQIQPFASNIWEWGKTQTGANLITVDKEQIVLTLLPRTTGKFSRFGLRVNKMRYKHENFTEKYLSGGEVTVAYNPDDVSAVLEAFVWGTRGQFFWDGNKRTSLMLSNKILVSSGSGIMTITDKYMEQFNALLLNYYNTGKSEELKQFLYENAIQGMTI